MRKYIQTSQGQIWMSNYILNMTRPEHGFVCEITLGTRTLPQNNALYKYFQLLSDALNSAGLEISMQYLGKNIDVPWTPSAVKERLWLPVMEASTGKTSTAKLDIKEVSEIYEVLNRHMAEKFGVLVMFPNRHGD